MNVSKINEIKKSIEIGDEEKFVLRTIGYFYHDFYVNDLNKAFQYIKDLGIYKVVIEKDYIYICLERPGLLIGVKGTNIDALQKYFESKDIKKKIQIVEFRQSPLDLLTSWQYMYMNDDEL